METVQKTMKNQDRVRSHEESTDTSHNATLFKLSMRNLSNVTLVLPLSGLFICFVTGYIFQNDEIHETHCRVYNIIPSISSITGISPQKYLWRIVIALHISPRLIIAYVHRNFLKLHVLSKIIDQSQLMQATKLANVLHYLNLIEISALTGVTYVSNKENYRELKSVAIKVREGSLWIQKGYSMHEKIFITFMVVSLIGMVVTLRLLKVLQPNGPKNEQEKRSLYYKRMFFALSIASTIGLIVFFLKHRLLCHDLAFSWFAFCEYLIAFSNMGFHCTTTMVDFPADLNLLVKNENGNITIGEEEEDRNNVKKD